MGGLCGLGKILTCRSREVLMECFANREVYFFVGDLPDLSPWVGSMAPEKESTEASVPARERFSHPGLLVGILISREEFNLWAFGLLFLLSGMFNHHPSMIHGQLSSSLQSSVTLLWRHSLTVPFKVEIPSPHHLSS